MQLLQEVLTAALEAGLSTLVFDTRSAGLAEQWSQIGRFTAVKISENGDILSSVAKVCPHDWRCKAIRIIMRWTGLCQRCLSLLSILLPRKEHRPVMCASLLCMT